MSIAFSLDQIYTKIMNIPIVLGFFFRKKKILAKQETLCYNIFAVSAEIVFYKFGDVSKWS